MLGKENTVFAAVKGRLDLQKALVDLSQSLLGTIIIVLLTCQCLVHPMHYNISVSTKTSTFLALVSDGLDRHWDHQRHRHRLQQPDKLVPDIQRCCARDTDCIVREHIRRDEIRRLLPYFHSKNVVRGIPGKVD